MRGKYRIILERRNGLDGSEVVARIFGADGSERSFSGETLAEVIYELQMLGYCLPGYHVPMSRQEGRAV